MKSVRYVVAMSLDGYIAGPKGEFDWILMDPEIDFTELYEQFDTFLLGRRTFEAMGAAAQRGTPGMKTIVFSRTLRQEDNPGVTIVAKGTKEAVNALRAEPGKDIWLYGGGSLFRSLLDAGLVDTVEVAIIPILLGEGIQLLPPPGRRTRLKLAGHRVFSQTGIVSLQYSVG